MTARIGISYGGFFALVLFASFVHPTTAWAQASGAPTPGAKPAGPQPIGGVTQSFTGQLFDATGKGCGSETKAASPGDTCPPSICTVGFGIRLPDGKLYNFDESGNPKATVALRKSRKGSNLAFSYWKSGKASKPIVAHVTGSVTSDVLNLETIRID